MTLATDIIQGRMPDMDQWIREGNALDDIDEYGFTPLIECAITNQPDIATRLLARGADVNKPDVTGRTALHWAIDNEGLALCKLLLEHGANPNAYTSAGMPVLVYPVLRGQSQLKQLLYQYGAKLDFALDFIQAKLIGHRFELRGDVDIVNAGGEFIEVDYEGFILEFTVAIIHDSLRRFASSFATRHLREYFPRIHAVMDGFAIAARLLKLQHVQQLQEAHLRQIAAFVHAPLLILPAASRGHALCFVRLGSWWAKIDRGENSLKEGSVNFYHMRRPEALNADFIRIFLFEKQPRLFFHKHINKVLGLEPVGQLPIPSQIAGNCSWANVRSVFPAALALQDLAAGRKVDASLAMHLDAEWEQWDGDRAIDECIQRFWLAPPKRQASLASMLGGVLFESCNSVNPHHLLRAEKILAILERLEVSYILQSYLDVYCVQRLSKKGNNLLQILEACGINPNIGVHPVATRLEDRGRREK